MPPPYPKPRQPPQSHRTRHRGRRADRQGRHPRRDRRGTQGQPGRQAQPERGQDRMESRRAPAGMLGRSDRRGDGGTGQDRQSHPQTVRATQSRWDAAEGTATTADADRAQRGTESRRRGFSCAVYINLTLRQYERTGNGKTLPKDGNVPAGGVLENASIYVVQIKQSRLMPIV